MAKKPRPNWTPAMVQSPNKKAAKAPAAKTVASPVKRGRPKKSEEVGSGSFLYLDADFYLVKTPEGYAAAAEDWWGEVPSSLAKGPDEFPAIVAFFERTENGPKIQSSYASRSALGFTKEVAREGTAAPEVIERIVEKVIEVPVDRIVEKVVEVPSDPTFGDALRLIFSEIASRIPFL